MTRRMQLLLTAVAVLLAACGSGPTAPQVAATELACAGVACVTYPSDWTLLEQGDSFLRFAHPADPDAIVASVGTVNMQALAEAAGGEWPTTVENVVRGFWVLLEEGGSAEFGSLGFLQDGSVRSFGVYEGGRLWHRLVPVDLTGAIGIEMRAPNSSWSEHADVFLDGLTITP